MINLYLTETQSARQKTFKRFRSKKKHNHKKLQLQQQKQRKTILTSDYKRLQPSNSFIQLATMKEYEK